MEMASKSVDVQEMGALFMVNKQKFLCRTEYNGHSYTNNNNASNSAHIIMHTYDRL